MLNMPCRLGYYNYQEGVAMNNRKYFSAAFKCVFALLLFFVIAVYGVSISHAQELVGDGLVCFIDFSQPNNRNEPVCTPATNITLRYSVLKSRLLEEMQIFPVTWINNCSNDTQMLSYQITASNSELLTQGFRFEPLASGQPPIFPSGTTTSNLIRFTVTAPPEMEIEARIHRVSITIARAGTTPPVSVLHFELEVIDDTPMAGDLTLHAIQRGVEHIRPSSEFAESLIFSFDEGGYRNARGEILTERHIAPLLFDDSLKRSGITADGNTRLFLVAQLKLESIPENVDIENLEAVFSIGPDSARRRGMHLESLSRTQRSNDGMIRINFEPVNVFQTLSSEPVEGNILQATAVLIAPEYITEPSRARFEVEVSVAGAEGTEDFKQRQVLEILQPPVVFIHGLWSDNRTWGNARNPDIGGILQVLTSRGYVTRLYEYPGTDGPLVHMTRNQDSLHDMIINALEAQIERFNVASSQVDLVVHSMGGLIARRFMYDNNYFLSQEHNAFNYQRGSVRRLITIATPHNGSPLADLLIRRPLYPHIVFNAANPLHQVAYTNITDRLSAKDWTGWIPGISGKRVFTNPGLPNAWERTVINAVEDIAPQSSNRFIRNINSAAPSPPVPMHTIAGDANNHFVSTIFDQHRFFTSQVATGFDVEGADVHHIVFRDISDAIVCVSSAHFTNNNRRARATTAGDSQFDHVRLTRNPNIAVLVLRALTSGLEIFSTPAPRRSPRESSIFDSFTAAILPVGAKIESVRRLTAEPETLFTSSHTTATTGDTITFTLTLPYHVTGSMVSAKIRVAEWFDLSSEYEMTRVDDLVYEFSYTIRGRTSGRMRIRADVFTEDEGDNDFNWLVSNVIDLNVIPRIDTLWGMEVFDDFINMTVGREMQVNVLGAFEDGFDRIINEGFMGTTYEITGDLGIAAISEDGLLSALRPGEGTLIVRNGDISATARIRIRQPASYWSPVDPELDLDPGDVGSGSDENNNDGQGRRRRGGCNAVAGSVFMLLALLPFLRRNK